MSLEHSTPTNRPDIFIHVPKTGGTSLRTMVVQHYGPENVWLYRQTFGQLVRADAKMLGAQNEAQETRCRRIMGHLPSPVLRSLIRLRSVNQPSSEAVFATAAAVFGHFTVDTFDKIPAAHEAKRFTVVREPLARMVSHYRALKESGNLPPVYDGWMKDQDAELPFAKFALHDTLQNFQTKYVGSDPTRFSALGTTEHLADFVHALGLIETSSPVTTRGVATAPPLVEHCLDDPGFQRDFQEFHAADYAFYDAASAKTLVSQ